MRVIKISILYTQKTSENTIYDESIKVNKNPKFIDKNQQIEEEEQDFTTKSAINLEYIEST